MAPKMAKLIRCLVTHITMIITKIVGGYCLLKRAMIRERQMGDFSGDENVLFWLG